MNSNFFFNRNYQLRQLIYLNIKFYNFSATFQSFSKILNIWTPLYSLMQISVSNVTLYSGVLNLSTRKYRLGRSNYIKSKYNLGKPLPITPKVKLLRPLITSIYHILFFFWYNSHLLFFFWYRWAAYFNSIYSFRNDLLGGYRISGVTYTLTYL